MALRWTFLLLSVLIVPLGFTGCRSSGSTSADRAYQAFTAYIGNVGAEDPTPKATVVQQLEQLCSDMEAGDSTLTIYNDALTLAQSQPNGTADFQNVYGALMSSAPLICPQESSAASAVLNLQ